MALCLTGKEFESIRDQFLLIDQDGDGRINREEIVTLLEGQKEENVEFMMTLMDVDGNGTIEFHEFLEIMAFLSCSHGLNKDAAKQMFRALDKDNDGFLSDYEIKHFYDMICDKAEEMPSAEDIEKMVKSLDSNGDGKIDLEEFIKGIDQIL